MGKQATKIQSEIAKYCDKSGRFKYNKRVVMARAGYPDVEVYDIETGITYNFEVKAGDDILSDIQVAQINSFNRKHIRAFEVRSIKEFDSIIKEVIDECR